MRTREVWIHAGDLRNGGSVHLPPELVDLLLEDLVRVWRRKRGEGDPNVRLETSDSEATFGILDSNDGLVVRGSAADLVAWGTGRSSRGVLDADGRPPDAPPSGVVAAERCHVGEVGEERVPSRPGLAGSGLPEPAQKLSRW